MSVGKLLRIGLVFSCLGISPLALSAAAVPGDVVYRDYCSACHDGGNPKAPSKQSLQSKNARFIIDALTKGRMQGIGSALSSADKESVAKWLTRNASVDANWEQAQMCSDTSIDLGKDWYQVNWGFDQNNSRFQANTRLNSNNVHRLKRKWALAFPGGNEMRSQPVVIGDTLFLAVADLYKVYAIDRHKGCFKWIYELDTPPRSAVGAGKLADGRPVVFLGDITGGVHVIDARSGGKVWAKRAAQTRFGVITGSPVLYKGVLYVPHSGSESIRAVEPLYECCRSQGMVTAHNIEDGTLIWTGKVMEDAKPIGKNSAGATLYGPAGVSIWATPVIDSARNQIIVGTGPYTMGPEVGAGDAIIAFDLKTGIKRWSFQGTKNDFWNSSCRSKSPTGETHPNCPQMGLDFDFGAAPIVATTKDGNDIILAGQKSGRVYGINPESGELLWVTRVSDGAVPGGIHWGMTQHDGYLYVPVNDPDMVKMAANYADEYKRKIAHYKPRPGLYKLDIRDGRVIWEVRMDKLCQRKAINCGEHIGLTAAPVAIDGAVIAPSSEGRVLIFAMDDGELLFDQPTAFEYTDTVNKIKGQGGAIDNATMAVADNQLIIQSGYGTFGTAGGNMLVVFELEDSYK